MSRFGDFKPDINKLAQALYDRAWSDDVSDKDRACLELASESISDMGRRCLRLSNQLELVELENDILKKRISKNEKATKRVRKSRQTNARTRSPNSKKNRPDETTE